MHGLINWFNENFRGVIPEPEQGQQHVLVRLPSNHLLWLSEEHYQLVDQEGHAICWLTNGEIHIVPLETAIRDIYVNYEDIFLWATEVEYQRHSPEVPEGSDGWPYSAMSIRAMNQYQMRNGPVPNKRRDIDVHVPYDPRLGF
jgi:hypothetical protein